MNLDSKKSFLINLAFSSVFAISIYIVGKFLLKYFVPFIIAFLIAWMVQKPAKYISTRLKITTGSIAATVCVLFYVAVISLIVFLSFSIINHFKNIINEIPDYLNTIGETFSRIKADISTALKELSPYLAEQFSLIADDFLQSIVKNSGQFFTMLATSTFKSAPSFLFSCIIALVAGCYIAKDFENLLKFSRELFGKKIYGNIIRIKNILCNSVLKIAKGYLMLMGITFLELTIGFLILGIKYAPILALLISFIDLLPVLGVGTIIIPWVAVEFLWGNNSVAVILLIIYITVMLVRNFLEPKIIGKQIGIYPLFTLIAMFTGLKLIGFAGLIIFPVALIVIIKYYKDEIETEKADC